MKNKDEESRVQRMANSRGVVARVHNGGQLHLKAVLDYLEVLRIPWLLTGQMEKKNKKKHPRDFL
jgi:hypothetical protein